MEWHTQIVIEFYKNILYQCHRHLRHRRTYFKKVLLHFSSAVPVPVKQVKPTLDHELLNYSKRSIQKC